MKQKHISKALNQLGRIVLLWLAKGVLTIIFLLTIITEHPILFFILLMSIFILSIMIIMEIIVFIGILIRGNRI